MNKRKKLSLKKLIVFLLIFSVVAYTAFYLYMISEANSEISTQTSTDSRNLSKNHDVLKSQDDIGFNWTIDKELVYRLEWSIEQRAAQASDTAGYKIIADWHFKVISSDDELITVVTKLNKVVVKDGDKHSKILEDMLSKYLVYLDLTPKGKVLSVYVPDSLSIQDAFTLQQLNTIEVALSEDFSALNVGDYWADIEKLTSGSAEVKYTRISNIKVTKSRTKYIQSVAIDAGFGLEVNNSKFIAKLGNDWLDEYLGDEDLIIKSNGNDLSGIKTTVSMIRIMKPAELILSGIGTPDRNNAISLTYTSTPDNDGQGAWDKSKKIKLKELYGNVSMKEILSDLSTAVSNATNHSQTTAAIHALRDWIEADVGRANELVQELAKGRYSHKESARMVNALELASSSPEAQVALADLFLDETLPDILRNQAVIASSGVNQPVSDELIEALLAVAKSSDKSGLGVDPILNLGVLAEKNDVAYDALNNEFSSLLYPGADVNTEKLTATIDAFTNAKIDSITHKENINSLLSEHQDENVRAAAVEYLWKVTDSPTHVLSATLSDQSDLVQRTVVDALFLGGTEKNDASIISLEHAKSSSTSDKIRFHILNHVSKNPEIASNFSEEIEAIGSETTSQDIKDKINEILK